MTPEQAKLYATCEAEFAHLTKRASATGAVENIQAFFTQQRFLLTMMERLVGGQQPPAGPKTAWDHIDE